MKYYLSSYKLGNETDRLQLLIKNTSGKFAFIPNAGDFSKADPEINRQKIDENMQDLRQMGVNVEILDLQDYFGKEKQLEEKLLTFGGLYISGGNTFVLRQAMKLSGFDNIFSKISERDDFLYIAFSAGACVLSPTLKYYAITDDANDFPYSQLQKQIWDGLGVLDFIFEPHYNSDHPESASTDKEINALIEDKVLFRAYKDGEVMIIE